MNNDTRLCTIEGCNHKVRARGWCGAHYERWRQHGDPMVTYTPTRVRGTAEERFWAKVDAFGDCWEWTSGRDEKGYGKFRAASSQNHMGAHVFSWKTLVGPIPDGLELDHLCRNPPCVNPDHLEPVTHAENVRRGVVAHVLRARAAKITHCPRGHAYAGENLVIDGNARKCRKCKNDGWNRRYWEKKNDA